jgi:hypothetical protein
LNPSTQLYFILSFLEDTIFVPENIAIRLINDTDVSVEAFYDEIIKHLQKLQSQNPKLNRNEFNRYIQESASYSSHMSERKMRKKMMRMNTKKKIIDDEDMNLDMESSGDKEQIPITTYPPPLTSESPDLNDTTIIFDQEPEE